MNYQLHHGDCLEVMAGMASNSITAIVTDPPYGLGETPDIAELMQAWLSGHDSMVGGIRKGKQNCLANLASVPVINDSDNSEAGTDEKKAGERTSGKPNGAKRNVNGSFLAHANGVDLTGYGDTGSASRFFTVCPPDVPRLVYHSKASSSERNEGLDGMEKRDKKTLNDYVSPSEGRTAPKNGSPMENHHPTVKPLSLMQWLCRLVRQPANNLILDPFGGSGTTGVAALLEGCDTIIIEREADYIPIIRARLEHFGAEANMKPVVTKGKATDLDALPLFSVAQS